MLQTITCIECPIGCTIEVETEGGAVVSVRGNGCPRGDRYARDEVCHPMRMLTSTVPVRGGALRRVSVKTAAPIPRERIFAAMAEIHRLAFDAPVQAGQVLCPDLAGTGVPLVATKGVAAR